MFDYHEFNPLLNRFLDGSLDADELTQFEARLLADEEFAHYVARWCLLHRQIADLQAERVLHQLMDRFVTGDTRLPKALSRSAVHSSHGTQRRHSALSSSAEENRRSRWPGGALVVGAIGITAVALMLLAAGLWRAQPSSSVAAVQPSPGQEADTRKVARTGTVASLTRAAGAVWKADASVFGPGRQLNVGDRIALESGMVKVTFDCGAEVVLEGPCDFVVQSAMVGQLSEGRITADVPRRAFGFAVLSPGVDFVDLGTSFGVSVGNSGRTELHVFDGEVLCSQTMVRDRARSGVFHVTAQQAMEFCAEGGDPSDIAMNQEQFSELISLRHGRHLKPPRLVPDQLALWLAADLAVTTDPDDRVIAWHDVLYGDNRSAEDALQTDEAIRPALVRDAVHGLPAVRFNGESSYLLTTPLETTDDQTVLLVCQYSPSAFRADRVWGGQILNYDGPPSRELSNTLEPGILQIGEPLLEEQFEPTLLTGQVFAGFIGSATVESGRIDAVPVGAGTPVVVSYRYDYTHGKATLAINGRVHGESRAFAPQNLTSRKLIGRHAWKELYFDGDLAELVIYNKALSDAELAETTAYLADKYSIELDPGTQTVEVAE